MNEEILRIQKMVAEGKITPEESVELIESLRAKEASSPGSTARPLTAPPFSAPAEEKTETKKGSGSGLGTTSFVMFGIGLFLFLLHLVGHTHVGATAIMVMLAMGLVFGLAGWRSTAGKVGLIGSLLLTVLTFVFIRSM